jgi:hypothetical protein
MSWAAAKDAVTNSANANHDFVFITFLDIR